MSALIKGTLWIFLRLSKQIKCYVLSFTQIAIFVALILKVSDCLEYSALHICISY